MTLTSADYTPQSRLGLPPMMQRYLEFKDRFSDTLLFFQVGDFFELFFEDAVTVSKALNLTLTSRDKNDPKPIPMCGVPIAVIDSYVDRLVALGYSAAIVSQVAETVAGKQVIERKLERLITPGMRLFSHTSNDPSEAILLAVGFESEGLWSIACSDPQSGIIRYREQIDREGLGREIATLAPREIILPRKIGDELIDRRSSWVRIIEHANPGIPLKFREVDSREDSARDLSSLTGFTTLSPGGKRSVRLLLSFIDETTLGPRLSFRELVSTFDADSVSIDASTRRNLELVVNSKDGGRSGTLYNFLNRTRTVSGARLLRRWVLYPLRNKKRIQGRLDGVAQLVKFNSEREQLQSSLDTVCDLERMAARIDLDVATPKDLAAIRDGVDGIKNLRDVLAQIVGSTPILSHILDRLKVSPFIPDLLNRSLADTPPHLLSDGGVIREGYDPELDSIRDLRSSGDRWMTEFEAGERISTGIGSLKIKKNGVIGYFIEITATHAARAPDRYIRRQSMANVERFTTPELREREGQVVSALTKELAREKELFSKLRSELKSKCEELRRIAGAVAELDVLVAFADLAVQEDLVCPILTDKTSLKIIDGRHPVIAARLAGRFISNSISFEPDGARFFIITGPNMGGKSTYLRQTALIVLMAQIGSYVPAVRAEIGIIDAVYARIGASDDLHEGDSTFMVEMREAAHILKTATERSLVLIDELGRGTATSDGRAIAQAIIEWLVHKVGARTLCATHFHELTVLEGILPKVTNLSVGSFEEDGQVIFTHAIARGPAPRSYGIEVARLSGLPEEILDRASELLVESVEGSQANGNQLSLFSRGGSKEPKKSEKKVEEPAITKLRAIDPDTLTPKNALDILYELHRLTVQDLSQTRSRKRAENE